MALKIALYMFGTQLAIFATSRPPYFQRTSSTRPAATVPSRAAGYPLSLHDLCLLMNRYVRSAEAYRKKWQPRWNEGRFKIVRPPEESDGIFREHVERIYGDGSPASA